MRLPKEPLTPDSICAAVGPDTRVPTINVRTQVQQQHLPRFQMTARLQLTHAYSRQGSQIKACRRQSLRPLPGPTRCVGRRVLGRGSRCGSGRSTGPRRQAAAESC